MGLIFIGIMMGLKNLLEKARLWRPLVHVFETVFPFAIVTVLMLWNEIGMNLVGTWFGLEAGETSVHTLIFTLTLTGFVPFRLVLMFAPPPRAVNILIGLAAFAWFVFATG
jgi:hypothetical protein